MTCWLISIYCLLGKICCLSLQGTRSTRSTVVLKKIGTLPDTVTFKTVRCRSNFQQVRTHYIYGRLCMYIQENPAEIPTPTQWNPTGHSKIALPPVIAQQYSSTTFISIHFHTRKENSGHISKVLFQFVNSYFRTVSLKLPRLIETVLSREESVLCM